MNNEKIAAKQASPYNPTDNSHKGRIIPLQGDMTRFKGDLDASVRGLTEVSLMARVLILAPHQIKNLHKDLPQIKDIQLGHHPISNLGQVRRMIKDIEQIRGVIIKQDRRLTQSYAIIVNAPATTPSFVSTIRDACRVALGDLLDSPKTLIHHSSRKTSSGWGQRPRLSGKLMAISFA